MTGSDETIQQPTPGQPATIAPSPAPQVQKPGRSATTSRETWSFALTLAGCALLAVWLFVWTNALEVHRFARWNTLWFEAWTFTFLDLWHNVLGARHWVGGGNPYLEEFGDPRGTYSYPPLTLPLFAWVALVDNGTASVIWWSFSSLVATAATWLAYRTRRSLKLVRIPFLFMLAVVLCSYYMLFQLERGQCDVLCLLMIVIACVALRSPRLVADVVAGIALAAGAWIKAYPGLLIPGLLALRRPRAFVSAVVAAAIMGLAPFPATIQWLKNASRESGKLTNDIPLYGHSISRYWASLFGEWAQPYAAKIPGIVGASLVLLPITIYVSYQVHRTIMSKPSLIYPYLLWLAAVATFWTPVSMDYNLIYLPLAILAVWSARDSIVVHALLLAFAITWQPFRIDRVSAEMLFWMKFAGLLAASISLVERAFPAVDVAQPGELARSLATA